MHPDSRHKVSILCQNCLLDFSTGGSDKHLQYMLANMSYFFHQNIRQKPGFRPIHSILVIRIWISTNSIICMKSCAEV